MRAMILAAGRGERLRPLTDDIPKPLIDIGETTLIEVHLDKLSKAGFREIVINLAHHGKLIEQALGDGSRWGIQIHYSREPEGALDTGGGIFKALPMLGDAPFAVINGDVYSHYPLARLRAVKCDYAHLVMVPNPGHHPEGDFGFNGGYLLETAKQKLTFSGISIYHPRFFNNASEGRFSIVPLLREAMAKRRVTGEIYRGEWHDVGTIERLEVLRSSRAQI